MKRIISDITQWGHLTQLVLKRWEKKRTPFWVTITSTAKTDEQLGYLHNTVLPIFTQVMFDAGEIERNDEDDAKYHLKVLICYGDWIKYKGAEVFNHKSFKDANKKTLSAAIDKAIKECDARGVYVPEARK